MKKIIIIAAFFLLLTPCAVDASIYNGDYEYGYYTDVYGEPHQVSNWDAHLICPFFEFVQQTREREYTGAFSYHYVDSFNTYYRVSFLALKKDKNDSFDFDKSRNIQTKIGNKNYSLPIDRIRHEKDGSIVATAKVSERYIMLIYDELIVGNAPFLSFTVPLKDGKSCRRIYV